MKITKINRNFLTNRIGMLLLIIILFTSCKITPFVEIKENENAYLIRNKNSIGEVFKEIFDSNEIDKSFERFTPTIEEINVAEIILNKDFLKKIKSKVDGKFIRKNLNDYKRQYLGYIDSNGDKIIFISFFLDKNIKKQDDQSWKEDYRIMFDGGASFWVAEINLKKNKVKNIFVNGIA